MPDSEVTLEEKKALRTVENLTNMTHLEDLLEWTLGKKEEFSDMAEYIEEAIDKEQDDGVTRAILLEALEDILTYATLGDIQLKAEQAIARAKKES